MIIIHAGDFHVCIIFTTLQQSKFSIKVVGRCCPHSPSRLPRASQLHRCAKADHSHLPKARSWRCGSTCVTASEGTQTNSRYHRTKNKAFPFCLYYKNITFPHDIGTTGDQGQNWQKFAQSHRLPTRTNPNLHVAIALIYMKP